MAFVSARSSRAGLIGREREVEQLAAHRRAAAEGHGRIVLIGGAAGIGKSQLLRHFAVGVGSGRAMVASARCVEFMQTPLSPLRELLSQLERRESAPHDAATRSLVERLAFERSADPAAGTLPGGSLFDSIDAAFARYALRGTVVLLVEDIHWADRSTLAFLNYLADTVEKRRTLVVATYRSDEVGSQHPRLSEFAALLGKRSLHNLSLPPLDAGSTRQLVELAAGPHAISSTVVADIVRRSQGNAFFAEELLKNALESRNAPHARELPLSIRGAVLALAARLSDEDRHVVSLAAVLGERFAVDQLVALMHGDRETVLRALERARALHLVYDEPAAPGDVAFAHALTQEVLYGELLAERVRPLHEAIARELERRPNREAASVELAHHWRRSGDLDRASAYDETAGDHAAAIGAFPDAILYYERARAARSAGSAELEHKLGVVLGASQQLNAGIERLRHAGVLYWSASDFKGFSENASALVAQLYNKGEPGAATALCHETIAALRDRLPREELDLFRARLAFHSLASLDDESASAFLNEIAEPITDPKIEMHVSGSRSRVAAMRGEINDWRVLSARALDAARRHDGSGSWPRLIHCQIALDALGLGETEAAREHLRAAMPPESERQSVRRSLQSVTSAFEHTLRGDFATASALLADETVAAEQSYTLRVHVKTANFVLGICSGDEARLRRDDSESFLRYGVDRGMKLAIGLLGGPYAWALGLRGELGEAAAWIEQIANTLPGPHRFFFAYLAAAQFGRPVDVQAMRRQLVTAAERPQDRVNKAVLGLFDAFASQRGIIVADPRPGALAGASGFEGIGWTWLAARAYELAGESRRASETYRSLGSLRDLHRVEAGRSNATVSVLSSRELEVAELASSGHSNEEIAQILHISSRTAEKHVASALRKLNLRSRVQLGTLLARSRTHQG